MSMYGTDEQLALQQLFQDRAPEGFEAMGGFEGFDPSSDFQIRKLLESQYGLPEDTLLNAFPINPIKSDLIKGAKWSTYNPLIENMRTSSDYTALRNAVASRNPSPFAHAGWENKAHERRTSALEGLVGKTYSNIMSNVNTARGSILDQIDSWMAQALEFSGGSGTDT